MSAAFISISFFLGNIFFSYNKILALCVLKRETTGDRTTARPNSTFVSIKRFMKSVIDLIFQFLIEWFPKYVWVEKKLIVKIGNDMCSLIDVVNANYTIK